MKTLERILNEKGYTKEIIIKELCIPVNKFKEWNLNIPQMDIHSAKKITKLLNITCDHLVLGEETETIDVSYLTKEQLTLVLRFYHDSNKINIKNEPTSLEINDIGSRIRYIYKDILNTSQVKLGTDLGVSRSTVQFWLSNMNLKEIKRILAISLVSGISLDYIIFDDYPLSITTYELPEKKVIAIKNMVEYYNEINNKK